MSRFVYGPGVSGEWNPTVPSPDVPGPGGPDQPTPTRRDATITELTLADTPEGVDATLMLESAAEGEDMARPVVLHVGVSDQTPPDDASAFLDQCPVKGSITVMDGTDNYVVQLRGLEPGKVQIYQSVLEFEDEAEGEGDGGGTTEPAPTTPAEPQPTTEPAAPAPTEPVPGTEPAPTPTPTA